MFVRILVSKVHARVSASRWRECHGLITRIDMPVEEEEGAAAEPSGGA